MVIGIIGAGISGLIAAKKLALAGHDVTIIEKNRSLGGCLATFTEKEIPLDFGVSSFAADSKPFKEFVEALRDKGILHNWTNQFSLYDGVKSYKENPNNPEKPVWAGSSGLNGVAQYLSRWVDIKSEQKAGGLTYIGAARTKKRSWMINLTDISVFECDAVIIATPAPEAYGMLQTAQDETPARRIIRHIDEVQYNPCFSLIATYNKEMPDWKGIEVEKSDIRWIGNESSKIEAPSKTGIAIHSSPGFFRKNITSSAKEIKSRLLEKASEIAGSWLIQPEWSYLHSWKYFEVINPINELFIELEMEEAPLALIGDYLGGNSVEDAFLSGYRLAEYWINKYNEVSV